MKTPRFLVAACIALALAFTFSCSSDDDSDPPPAPVQLSSSGGGGSSSSDGGSSSSDGSSSSSDGGSSSSDGSSSSEQASSSSDGGSSSSDGAQAGIGCSIDDYSIVKIGNQFWMAENMNCEVDGSECYEGDPANCVDYGRLYTWEAATLVCPIGWHLPSDDDWNELYAAAEEDPGECSDEDGYCPTAGKHLKSKTGWEDCGPSDSGSTYSCEDTYGFSALPGGVGFSDGGFDDAGYFGGWWSSSEWDVSGYAYYRDMYYDNEFAGSGLDVKTFLYSVRCVQD